MEKGVAMFRILSVLLMLILSSSAMFASCEEYYSNDAAIAPSGDLFDADSAEPVVHSKKGDAYSLGSVEVQVESACFVKRHMYLLLCNECGRVYTVSNARNHSLETGHKSFNKYGNW